MIFLPSDEVPLKVNLVAFDFSVVPFPLSLGFLLILLVVVIVGEVLYTVDQNQSEFVKTDDNPEGIRVAAPDNEQNVLGVNIMMRARF